MKNERYNYPQIIVLLKQAEGGVLISWICRKNDMSSASFYKWRAKFGGMDASLISEMKDMAEENRRLKRMYAEMSMQNDLLKEALGKKR
tara:strand:+ start:230 stop:496 length:267 start_codon:yes stop_codon:yes gene_type:complete